MSKLVYYRYRHKWAWGQNDWRYDEAWVNEDNPQKDLDEYAEMKMEANNFSDKYRGLDLEIVDRPPDEWIRKHLMRCVNLIWNTKQRAIRLYKLLGGPPVTCTDCSREIPYFAPDSGYLPLCPVCEAEREYPEEEDDDGCVSE